MATVYKGTGTKIARLAGIQPLLDEAAAGILARAESNAAAHHRTGRYSNAFVVKPARGRSGVMDRLVTNTHPASAAIEFGHFAATKSGKAGRYVPGQHNLRRAIG
ncbi:DUF5403 family protein [Corynebacterium heidelbergense]|uniref:HK97 gp10 family phage protein n=1 Tax=Corynebacterium heidelbergense TaxID=2055947 RepID=A0A364VCA1_9CORY|nr:DUF5403 family protein [Corynebacterium heidelbergense]RAV34254.1 hypothetical protein CWC39_04175 [Corynebacterium heidelbergense]WCZ36974.1 hypothetical protein CHEID_07205 [Corynebacterium heidelbergense]